MPHKGKGMKSKGNQTKTTTGKTIRSPVTRGGKKR